ncbi:hypothetical protein F5X99DRAFT_121946 [Biscogniauxia marginata]|nr:hypothetical protein F5X99DRAFT_121946 [Biscogniauxia marginata]
MLSVRSRAATSCYRCRARKQKCDALRPTCSRCQRVNEPCIWPATQKRGPAKGYTEALEHRLAETENVLLQLLSVTGNETLCQALGEERPSPRRLWASNDAASPPSTTSDGDLSLPGPNKAGLIAHWDRYPLNTADSIRLWAEKNLEEHTKTTMKCVTSRQTLDSLDLRERGHSGTQQPTLLSESWERDQQDPSGHIQRMPSEAFGLSTSSYGNKLHNETSSDETALRLANETTSFPDSHISTVEQDSSSMLRPNLPDNERKRKIELSRDFRQQFLW